MRMTLVNWHSMAVVLTFMGGVRCQPAIGTKPVRNEISQHKPTATHARLCVTMMLYLSKRCKSNEINYFLNPVITTNDIAGVLYNAHF